MIRFQLILPLAFLLLDGASGAMKGNTVFPCWERKDNSFSPDFIPAPHTTKETCMRYCLTLKSCAAIMWDKNQSPSCFVQPKITDAPKIESKIGSGVYLLDRTCLEPHITPYGPEICWEKKAKTFYQSLTNVKATSLRDCLNSCIKADGCQLANFILDSEAPCSIQTVKSPIDKKNFTDQESSLCFVLNRECLNYFTNVQIENRDMCWRPLKDVTKNFEKVEKPTRSSCMDYCQDTQGCLAVKYDNSCFVSKVKALPNNGYSTDELAVTLGLDRSCL